MIHYNKMVILEPAALQPSEKKKALENAGINFYFGSSSSLAGCSVRGAADSVPPGAAIDPRPAPREQGGVANSSNWDAFAAVPISHKCVRGITTPLSKPSNRIDFYVVSVANKQSHDVWT
jgi:hypothetical protein